MTPIVYGVTSLGTPNVLQWYGSPDTLRAERGEGPAVETVAYLLNKVGGPVGLITADPSVAADNTTVTASGGGPEVTVAGSSTVDAFVRIDVVTAGILGAGKFRYALDGYSGDEETERTYSEVLTIPTGGTFAIPGTGLTLTFAAGSYVVGEFYAFQAECAAWNATDLADAIPAAQNSLRPWRFLVGVTSRNNGDAAAHAVLAAALQTHLDGMANVSKHRRAMIASTHDFTETPDEVATAFASTVVPRLLVAHERVKRISPKPFSGWSQPVTDAVDCFAARAAGSLPSTDLKRVRGNGLQNGGPLPGVLKIFHNEEQTPTSLDDAKLSTLRTYSSGADSPDGFFITQGRLKSGAGSDFSHWPRGIVMDIACETVHAAQTLFIGAGFRLNADGTIDERDAIRWEEEIGPQLAAQLLSPRNAEGFDGHVTGVRYRLSREHNVSATGTIISAVGIKPLGYADYIYTYLGFVTQFAEDQAA
jgi:hypothetical protein